MAENDGALVLQGNQVAIRNQGSPEIAAAAEREKAHTLCAFQMAALKSRDVDQFRVKLLQNCKRPGFAQLVEYSKPIGGKSIKGLSVRVADTAIQLFGNMQCDTRIVYEDEQTRRLKVEVIDYETNVSKSSDITLQKTVERKDKKGREVISTRKNSFGEDVHLVLATEDELLVKQGASVAKARRDLILAMIPRDILDEARDTAAATLANEDSVDPAAARKKLVDAFMGVGVTPKMLAEYLKHPVDTVDKNELAELRRIYAAIANGEAKFSEFLNAGDEDKPKAKSPFEKPTAKKAEEKPAAQQTVDTVATEVPLSKPGIEDGVVDWEYGKV
jgi:hypothetical protein